MLFSSQVFLFYFLPAFLVLYAGLQFFILGRPCDVVIAGDSTGVGSQASDDETLAGLIRIEASVDVYNAAGVGLSWFLADRRFDDHPSQLVIVVLAERNLGSEELFLTDEPTPFRPREWAPSQVLRPVPAATMRSLADLAVALDSGRALRPTAEPVLKGLLFAVGLYDLPPGVCHLDRPSGMLFLAESADPHLDLLPILVEHRRLHPHELLYYLDDTHLNPLGHRMVFEAVRGRLPDRAEPTAPPRHGKREGEPKADS